MKWKIEVLKNRRIWKAFKSEEEWCCPFCHISFRSRDIQDFCIVQIRYWWRHKVWQNTTRGSIRQRNSKFRVRKTDSWIQKPILRSSYFGKIQKRDHDPKYPHLRRIFQIRDPSVFLERHGKKCIWLRFPCDITLRANSSEQRTQKSFGTARVPYH